MTDTDKAEYEGIIRMLTARLEEAVADNERLRAEMARLTEGANALSTLQSLYRDRDLPESLRAKAAIGCLPHEVPKIQSVPPPLDLVAEEVVPLAQLVEQRRARQRQLEGQLIEASDSGVVRILPKPASNGGNGSEQGGD